MKRFSPTAEIGITRVQQFFLINGWIPRAIYQSDVGIDMEVEIADEGTPTGQLIAIQVKSGKSYFKTVVQNKVVFQISETHGAYWLNHTLPVLIILHNPETDQTIWQDINPDTLTKTLRHYKVLLPLKNTLEPFILDKLAKLNKNSIYIQRLQRLAVQKQLISSIANQYRTVIEVRELVSKLSGQAYITIKQVESEDDEKIIMDNGYVFFRGIEDLEVLFPWANFFLDEDYYEESEEGIFNATYGGNPPISFNEYRDSLPEIRAIDLNGEVSLYRFQMELNEVGRAFLKLNLYLEGGHQTKLNFHS